MKPSKQDLLRDLEDLADELDERAKQAEINGHLGEYRGMSHASMEIEKLVESHE